MAKEYCEYEGHDYFPQYGVGPHRHDLSRTGSFINSTVPLKRKDEVSEDFRRAVFVGH